MDNIKQPQEMKSALDRQIAEALEAERVRQRAIEEQTARLRDAEIAKVRADIQMLMREYDLTREDVLGESGPQSKITSLRRPVAGLKSDRPRSLREIRGFYSSSIKS